jgi:hypothetical protein
VGRLYFYFLFATTVISIFTLQILARLLSTFGGYWISGLYCRCVVVVGGGGGGDGGVIRKMRQAKHISGL